MVRDLGIQMSADFKPSLQCAAAAAKARRALFQLKAAIRCKDVDVFVPLYCAFVRPHLEYCIQPWAPYLRKDTVILERVQRLATRMVSGTKGLSYDQRLQICGLFSLERRRLRGDLLEAYRITHSQPGDPNCNMLPANTSSVTRGHDFKLAKRRVRLDLRKYSFSLRVVNPWNKLPRKVVTAPSLGVFKEELDRIWEDVFPDLR